MQKVSQKKAGVVLSYLSQGVNMISALVYTPIMLRILGQSEYGVYQLVNSVIAYLGLLNFGFSGAYLRFYSRFKSENNKSEISKLNGMFFNIFTIITILCLICGFIMVKNIELVFDTGLTESEYSTAKVLLTLMVISLAASLMCNVFTCYATAHEQFIFQRVLELLQNLLNPFIALPLLLAGKGSIGMVCVSTALVLLKIFCTIIFCIKKLHISIDIKGFNPKLFKEISRFTLFIFLNQMIDQINLNLDKVLLGRFANTIAVATYAVASNIHMMYRNMLSSISNVFIPKVNMICATANDDNIANRQLTTIFTDIGRIQFIVAYLVMSGYIFFGKPFINLWAGDGYEIAYIVGLWLIIPSTVELIQYLGMEIQRAKNMHHLRTIVYSVTTILNVCLSIPLIIKFGVQGAAIGTAISIIIGNWIIMNIIYHKKIGLDILYYWKNIAKFIPSLIPSIVLGVVINCTTEITKWYQLFVFIIIYTVVYGLSVYFLGLNKNEKDMVLGPLTKILKKLRLVSDK